MQRRMLSAVLLFSMLAMLVAAQESSRRPQRASAAAGAAPDKALMQRIWDAWATMDPTNAAPYYDKQAGDVFFDIAPVKYAGWDDYAKGAANVIQQSFTALKFTVNDDARVRSSEMGAFGTATIDSVLTGKDGKTQHMTLRWTVIWANENGRWLIIHEHVSAPLS